MIYEMKCSECGHKFEVVKPVRDFDEPAPCPECDSVETLHQISAVSHSGAKVKDAYYDSGLGTVVKSDKDRKEHMKIKDFIEVGTEPSKEAFHKNTVVRRQIERDKEWGDL